MEDRDVRYSWEDEANHGDGSERLAMPWATLTLLLVFAGSVGYAAYLLVTGR